MKHKNDFFDQNAYQPSFWNDHKAIIVKCRQNQNGEVTSGTIDFTGVSERKTLKKDIFRSLSSMKFPKLLFCLFPIVVSAQQLDPVGIGQWKSYMSLSTASDVSIGHGKVYTSFSNGIYAYDLEEGSYELLSKDNGLSSINITQVEYVPINDLMVVGYADGNLDIIKSDLSITNMSDIKRSNIIGDKSIYRLVQFNGWVYICTGFGIVVLDPVRLEIKDTYIFGPGGSNIKVNSVATDGTLIYAATDQGLYSASIADPFLANYTSWTKNVSLNAAAVNGPFNGVAYNNGNLFLSRVISGYNNDSLYRYDGSWSTFTLGLNSDIQGMKTIQNKLVVIGNGLIQYFDENFVLTNNIFQYLFGPIDAADIDLNPVDGNSYIADRAFGLTRAYNAFDSEKKSPTSPNSSGSIRVAANKGAVWLTHDGYVGVNVFNSYSTKLFSGIYDGKWVNFNHSTQPLLTTDSIFDAVSIVIDPNDENHVFMGSYSYKGITEVLEGNIVGFYDETNSELEDAGIAGYNAVSVMKFDADDNLWVVNSRCNNPLVVKKEDGTWRKFDLGSNVKNKHIFDMEVGKSGFIWLAVPTGNNTGGLMLFDYGGTIDDLNDDRTFFYTMGAGYGNLPSLDVRAVTEDLDEEIWIGTANGISVVYNQEAAFQGSNFDAQQILIEQDGNIQILLEGEIVQDIEVDGANRKWIATEGSGAYLISEDGTEEIVHFTAENSPLLSNIINDIEIDDEDGTVYFATSDGLVSYRSTATGSGNAYNEVIAFPNPVRHDYDGIVAVKGLSRDSDFKITDISGNLVFHGISEGGQAIWDLKDIKGNRVSTGVYLVYCNSKNGNKDAVAKLLIIN